MKSSLVSLVVLLTATLSPACAQPNVVQASMPATASIYAQQQIDLLPGFETTRTTSSQQL